MEQQEKQAIRSQRLRRAVTCMKRKEREGGEEDDDSEEEEETPTPSKSKKGKAASKSPNKGAGQREVERSVGGGGGGFLGSEVMVEPPLRSLRDESITDQEFLSVKDPQSKKNLPQRVRKSSGSSSSGEDSDGGDEVAMVTARSVFEGSQRGRKTKSTRGKGSARGKGRGKKL